ncbi:MAG: peptidyl-prolyl cis-trans isomerase [Firmicutes bacterium]|nr:peptidyl-prolyl cis-trans isomerase [Bacillota bacterium]
MKKSIMLLISLLAALSLLCGCSFVNNNWIISIDGDKIDKEEFEVYLHEQVKAFEATGGSDIWAADFDGVSAQEVAKQNAANSLLRAKLAVKEAPSLGVSTAVDENEVESGAKELYDAITADTSGRMDLSGVTLDMCKDIIRDGLIQKEVYDAVTGSYEVNLQDFESYLQDYYNENAALYKNLTVKTIYVAADPNAAPAEGAEILTDEYANLVKKDIDLEGRARIEEAYQKLQSGDTFTETQFNYSEQPDKREFTVTPDMYDDEVLAKLYSLKKGEYSDIIEYDGGYYIFWVKEMSETPIDDIRGSVEEAYIAEKKEEVYRTQNDSWLGAADIKRNGSVWESVVINVDAESAHTDEAEAETGIPETVQAE